jgi:hypothetical protein
MAGPLLLYPGHFFHSGTSNYPPGSDVFFDVWQFWWVKRFFLGEGSQLFFTDTLFYPRGASLEFSLNMLFWDVISIPLQSFLSLPAIHNIFFLVATVVSALGAFSLAKYVTGSERAGYFSGLVFAFNPFRFVHIDHLEVFSTLWIPYFALSGLKLLDGKRLRHSIQLGAIFTLACYTDLIYSTLLAVIFPLLLIHALFVSRKWRASDLRQLWPFLAITSLCVGPYFLILLRDYLSGRAELSLPLQSSISQSADLFSFFVPSFLHPVFGSWAERFYAKVATFDNIRVSGYSELVAYLGFSVLFLVAVCLRKSFTQRVRGIFLFSLVFLVLSLGPALKALGLVILPASALGLDRIAERFFPGLDPLALKMLSESAGIPLPFLLFHFLPVLKGIQSATRLFVFALLGLSILSGKGYAVLSGGASKGARAVFWIAPCFLLFEYLSWKLPHQEIPIHKIYHEIKKDPEDIAVLDLPLTTASTSSDPRHKMKLKNPFYNTRSALSMYYQTVHGKKILGGILGRWPKDIGEFVPSFLVKYIVVHKEALSITEVADLRRVLPKQGFRDVFEDSETWALVSESLPRQ